MNKRIDVRKLYDAEDIWGGWSNYQPMIDAFGNVVVQVDDDDYQGDTRVIYDNDGRIGWLIFGWGSCGGCDALQACDDIDEVQELCDSLQNGIKWFDSKQEALSYFKNKDWETEWYWHEEETKRFVKEAIDYLSRGKDNGEE